MTDFDNLLAKVVEFTDVEIALMEEWLGGVLRGHLRLANAVLRTGLLLEHWQSVLDPDPTLHSAEEVAKEGELRTAFEAARLALRDAGGQTVDDEVIRHIREDL